MQWWPGTPHLPELDPDKVRNIQRSLDWKRVVQIAAYLLQNEIVDVQEKLDKYFRKIYEPKKFEPGREWPPKVGKRINFQPSEFPTFSNVLLHVNGARIDPDKKKPDVAKLRFNEDDRELNFTVIDGQHRINGAYFAIKLLQEKNKSAKWKIPTEIFLDLDPPGEPPRKQAQIFIDVNFNQKKVDRSLVADLFPTARGREPFDNMERAQDLGRKLMLEIGPLVGMIQIPGIKFGVKDVVTLSTLNSAIENVLNDMFQANIQSLELQGEFLAQCLDAWLEATGRKEEISESDDLDPENVAYQGRVIVSFLTLIPACIWKLKKTKVKLISEDAKRVLIRWLGSVMRRVGLLDEDQFLPKSEFRKKGYLGSGGLARFRDTLWAAAIGSGPLDKLKPEELEEIANKHRALVKSKLGKGQ